MLSVALFAEYRNATVGYCNEQGRYLLDKEYIIPELSGWMAGGMIEVAPSVTSAEAYLANHPDCCKVFRNSNRSLLDALFDFHPITIGCYFERNKNDLHWRPKETYLAVEGDYSSCGKYQGRRFAPEPVPSPEYRKEMESKKQPKSTLLKMESNK